MLLAGAADAQTPARPAGHADAGSVLLVMADDLGIDALSLYGLDPRVAHGLTPNLDALAGLGIRFENVWSAPKCSPGRAALHTGMAAFRTGIGNVIEGGNHGLPTSALTLPEMLELLAPVPWSTGYFGKWHLEPVGSSQVCAPSALHGYDDFVGTLLHVPSDPGYCDWRLRDCGGASGTSTSTRTFEYMPGRIFDEAVSWIRTRPGPWLCTLAPQLPYDNLHTPPSALQAVRNGPECSSCPPETRACYDAALQTLDTKLGAVLRTLGDDWPTRVTVIFTADNGTPNGVNRYWPEGRAKLSLFEGGVRVPLLIAGRGVPPGRRGSVARELVSITDLYRTIARLAGVTNLPPGTARDSFDLAPLLADPPRPNGRTLLVAETFGRNQSAPPYIFHKVALRDARYKLIYDWTGRRPQHLYDLANDPRELVNLLGSALQAPSTPAGAALLDLVARLEALLGS